MGAQLDGANDPAGMRDAWSRIEDAWSATIERARRLPESALHERVADEWSLVETLRHLVFVTDAWVRRTIRSEARPYHRLGLPPDDDVDVGPWGIDVDADPSFADVLAARLDRMAAVRHVVSELTPVGFARICAPNPGPGFPSQTTLPVGLCLNVVVGEERAHHRYAVRDLAVLESAS
jgi:DinB superfamily